MILATPAEVSATLVPLFLDRGVRAVDMSGAFRLADASLYPELYGSRSFFRPRYFPVQFTAFQSFFSEYAARREAHCERRLLCNRCSSRARSAGASEN